MGKRRRTDYSGSIFFGLSKNWHALHSCVRALPGHSEINPLTISGLEAGFTSLQAQENRVNRRARFSGRDF